MNRRWIGALTAALLLCGLAFAPSLFAQSEEVERVENAAEVFEAISSIMEKQVPGFMMKSAKGIAIFPDVRRLGLVVGIQKGEGLLVSRGKDGKWSPPLLLTLRGGSVGWQVGIQSVDLVLFFQTRKSVDSVLRGELTLGVDASVSAGSLGRQAAASTDTELESEVYSYSRSKGFFAGLSLSGASLSIDDEANEAYYGRKDLNPKEILGGSFFPLPKTATRLRSVLEKNAALLE